MSGMLNMNKDYPLVTAIIVTKNEEKNIGNCLLSLKKQTYPHNKLEVIVVDNNSTDKTKEIAKKYNCKIFNKGPERSAQRNFGASQAKGKYLLHLDADMIISSDLIERSVRMAEETGVLAIYLPEVVLGNSFWSQVRRFERSFYDGTVIDCVRFFRKDIYFKTKGFDASLSGPEDWDLDKKIRGLGKVAVLSSYNFQDINEKVNLLEYRSSDFAKALFSLSTAPLVFHNEVNFNLKKYFSKKNYYAKSFANYISKWGRQDPDIKKQFGFCYRYFGVFFENGKWKRVLEFPHLFLGMFFLRFGVGVTFLVNKK
jgi:glycosyltransferase involved in cell wall biosynthesis